MDELRLPFNEIDFLIPVHKFKINFSYVSKKGFPFVREFVLRLVHLAPVESKNIADYFGFSKNETNEAITNLVELGDLQYNEDGRIELTAQSQGYFNDLGDIPLVSNLFEYSTILGFELADYNCVGNKKVREKWKNALKVEVDTQKLSVSEKDAKRHFQSQFYSLIDEGYLDGLKDDEESSSRPSIYKIELVRKLSQEPLRVTQTLSLDGNGKQLERDDIEKLKDTTETTSLITLAIHENRKPDNKIEIFSAMGLLGDRHTHTYFTESQIDLRRLIEVRAINESGLTGYYPFLGQIYAKNNWDLVLTHFDKVVDQLSKTHLDGLDNLAWIAPADSFWGKSYRLPSCLDSIIKKSRVPGKKAKSLYKPVLYVPVTGENDNRARRNWENELSGQVKHVHGLVEGFLEGNVEVLVLPKYFAVVCYHFSSPDNYDVSLPLGFVTTDLEMVSKIAKEALDYISGLQGHELPNDIGSIRPNRDSKISLTKGVPKKVT